MQFTALLLGLLSSYSTLWGHIFQLLWTCQILCKFSIPNFKHILNCSDINSYLSFCCFSHSDFVLRFPSHIKFSHSPFFEILNTLISSSRYSAHINFSYFSFSRIWCALMFLSHVSVGFCHISFCLNLSVHIMLGEPSVLYWLDILLGHIFKESNWFCS